MSHRDTYRAFGTGSGLIAIACLSACTGVQIEAASMQKDAASTRESATACLQEVFSKPEFAGLSKKLYLSTLHQTVPPEYLNNDSNPTKPDIADLYRLHGDVQACRKIVLDGASARHPLILTVIVESYSESDRLYADAVSGKLTWGQFNEARQTLNTKGLARLTEADTRIRGELQGQHQFEVEQRQRAAEAMQQWAYQQQQLYQQQQMIAAASRPVMINCNYSGTTVHCNSF